MPYLLPKNYQFNHQYCFFLHDLMVNIIKEGENKNYFSVKFNPKREEIDIFSKLTGEDLYKWMIANNYKDEAELLTFKQIFVATLTDFLQFIFTSLRSSEKGHLTVTYSLLRKPLKDNLFILELLLSNPSEFLQKFNSDNSYNEIAIEKQPVEFKQEIIADVLSIIPFSLLEKEFIYDLRYSKKKDYSLERLWQKATHIVTSSKYYKTESGNLNLIFSSEMSKKEQWEYLYTILPFILFYSYQVCSSIYYGVVNKDEEPSDEIWDRILIGHIISNRLSVNKNSSLPFNNDLQNITIRCQKCNEEIVYTKELEKQILTYGKYKCSKRHKNDFFKLP